MNWSGALFASCSSDKKNWSITQFIKYLKYKLQNLGQFFCTECLCNLFFISYSCSKYLGFNGIQSSVYFYTYPACRFYHCLNSKPLMLGGNVRLLFSFLDSTSHETAGLERQRRPPPPPTAFAATLRGSQEGFCASIEGHGFGKKLLTNWQRRQQQQTYSSVWSRGADDHCSKKGRIQQLLLPSTSAAGWPWRPPSFMMKWF